MNATEASIDRLVDGDLGPEARRALLLRLDAEPDGWRRCALAFLEAQCWRESLGPLARGAAPGPRLATRPARRRPDPARWSAVAAGLAAAFALGWAAGGRGGDDRREVADRTNPAPAAAPAPEEIRPRPEPAGSPSLADEAAPDGPATVLPASLEERWERRGYRVERRKALMAVGLKDGRRVAVPVEEVKLRYVGDRVY